MVQVILKFVYATESLRQLGVVWGKGMFLGHILYVKAEFQRLPPHPQNVH